MNNSNNNSVLSAKTLQEATGLIPYGMTNDYMFRAVLQSNNKVLRGLILSLLHLSEEEILSVEITNPIVLGEAITDKEFRLDINVMLNNNKIINLEMQVENQFNWTNRSLSYLCRSYDQLNKGQDYDSITPVIHIGILDFTLFKDYPEFYATYKLLNIKNHHAYTDNLALNVLDLKHIEMATDSDKKYKVDYWATLFKAKTWEELKMLAKENEYLKEASNSIFQLSAEDIIRKRCQDREDYYSDIRSYQKAIKKMDEEIKSMSNQLQQRDDKLKQRDDELKQRDDELKQRDDELQKMKQLVAELQSQVNDLMKE